MTKEKWIKKKTETIQIEDYYNFYKEKGGIIDNFSIFKQVFLHILQEEPTLMTDKGPKIINIKTATNKLFDYYDEKFGIYL